MDVRVRQYIDKNSVSFFLSEDDQRLIQSIQGGLPLVSHPFATIGAQLGMSEDEVLHRITQFQEAGIIKRLGVVVRHRELGYRANAMVVWDIPDDEVAEVGRCLSNFEFVTLCYRRPRRPPQWSYNLFCMIHGRDRDSVMQKYRLLIDSCGLEDTPKAVLFSRRRFKQRGAIYRPQSTSNETD